MAFVGRAAVTGPTRKTRGDGDPGWVGVWSGHPEFSPIHLAQTDNRVLGIPD